MFFVNITNVYFRPKSTDEKVVDTANGTIRGISEDDLVVSMLARESAHL